MYLEFLRRIVQELEVVRFLQNYLMILEKELEKLAMNLALQPEGQEDAAG